MPVIGRNILTAAPAPIIPALCTSHMHATSIFFNGNLTSRASVSSYFVSPAFVFLFLSSLACLSIMPFSYTLKAKIFLAWWALDLFCVLFGFNHNRTLWVWTESFFLTHHYFMILLKFFEFEVSIVINNFLKKSIRNLFLASLLRTY